MYRLIAALLFAPLFSQEIMISYFDQTQYEENGLTQYDLTTNIPKEKIDSAFMATYSYPINPPSSPLQLMGGTSLAKWNGYNDEMYAYSTYLTARLSPLTVLIVSPYVEVSLAGPTYLSKQNLGDLNFNSNLVYQNYISVGVKLASALVDVKFINYSDSLPKAFTKESINLPLILSVGLSY